MAFDFPASPSEGTRFTPATGPTYVYKNGVWRFSTAWELISRGGPVSNATSLIVPLPTTHYVYKFYASGIDLVGAANPMFYRCSVNNGSSYEVANYAYTMMRATAGGSVATFGTTGMTVIQLTHANIIASAGYPNQIVSIINPADTGYYGSAVSRTNFYIDGIGVTLAEANGHIVLGGRWTHLQLLSNVNINVSRWELTGIPV